MAAPLDTLEQAVNLARVRFNDAIESIGGDVLTDTQPFTIVIINGAYRRLQELLSDLGFPALKKETIFSNFPAAVSSDPGVFVSIDWTTTPALPADLIAPITLWERPYSASAPTRFRNMDPCFDGLPAVTKRAKNGLWEWRGQTLYLPGATAATDIRMRYAAFLADFVASTTTAFSAQNIPIVRALNPLAWLICAEMGKGRGDSDTGDFEAKAAAAAQQMATREGIAPSQPPSGGDNG